MSTSKVTDASFEADVLKSWPNPSSSISGPNGAVPQDDRAFARRDRHRNGRKVKIAKVNVDGIPASPASSASVRSPR